MPRHQLPVCVDISIVCLWRACSWRWAECWCSGVWLKSVTLSWSLLCPMVSAAQLLSLTSAMRTRCCYSSWPALTSAPPTMLVEAFLLTVRVPYGFGKVVESETRILQARYVMESGIFAAELWKINRIVAIFFLELCTVWMHSTFSYNIIFYLVTYHSPGGALLQGCDETPHLPHRPHRQEITAPAPKTTTNLNPKTASNCLQLWPCSK